MEEIKKVAVIGAGTMGHGIAQIVSTAGMMVALCDIQEEYLTRARSAIDTSLKRMEDKGKITPEKKLEILSNIHFTKDIRDAAVGTDLVIEAVPELLDLKKDIFRKLDEFTDKKTILATNTSQYSITDIASAVSDPTRVIGVHFFNPPLMMKLVEIVRGLLTSEEVLDNIRSFVAALGKETVVCRDSQGFISTRILIALRLECYRLLEEGVASKEDIDKTLRLAFGHPMGQFELADFSGLDLEPPVCEALMKTFGERFRPPQNILHLVKAGRFGRKSGEGWYKYSK